MALTVPLGYRMPLCLTLITAPLRRRCILYALIESSPTCAVECGDIFYLISVSALVENYHSAAGGLDQTARCVAHGYLDLTGIGIEPPQLHTALVRYTADPA